MVIAAGMGIGGGKLGIAQGSDQGQDSSQDPGKEKGAVTPRIGRNERGCLKDARPDDNTDYQRDAVDKGKRLLWALPLLSAYLFNLIRIRTCFWCEARSG